MKLIFHDLMALGLSESDVRAIVELAAEQETYGWGREFALWRLAECGHPILADDGPS